MCWSLVASQERWLYHNVDCVFVLRLTRQHLDRTIEVIESEYVSPELIHLVGIRRDEV